MLPPATRLLVAVMAIGLVPNLARPQATVSPSLDTVLARARAYVAEYRGKWASVICEERYKQATWGQGRIGGDLRTVHTTRRALRSDLLLLWVPEAATWTGYRDVLDVDGQRLRTESGRLESLAKRPDTTRSTLRAIADESARFNIGRADRNFNEPSLALRVLDPASSERFHFALVSQPRIAGRRTWLVSFEERASPTLIRNGSLDAPMRGSLWLDPDAGTVVKTELQVTDPESGAKARMVVEYALEQRLGLWMPRRMREWYEGGVQGIEGEALYSNFRRFETSGRLLAPQDQSR